MAIVRRICLGIAGLAGALFLLGLARAQPESWKPAAAGGAFFFAVGLGGITSLAGYQFTAWILAAVTAAMIYPERFLTLGPLDWGSLQLPAIDLKNKWLILVVVQLVMFGMGTKMSLRDFAGVAKMPYPVLIGIGLQFSVMPLTGYTLAKLFGFPPEIAAGVVLIGCCSSGLSSNVMCYLAGANLALSITLTALATMLAPLATPFWMQRLAGEFVEVDPQAMMVQIVKIVLVPIGAAMLHDYLKNAPARRSLSVAGGGAILSIALLAAAAVSLQSTNWFTPAVLEAMFIGGGAILFALVYHFSATWWPRLERQVHLLSMIGIIYFTAVTTAAGRNELLQVGLALVAAAVLHNLAGYGFGYGVSRLVGLDRNSALTVAFEVGMQNGGMASGLANFMGKLGTVGLAAAVFSPWMNVSGSILANQIRKHNLIATDDEEFSHAKNSQ